jgi:hypothetical protein
VTIKKLIKILKKVIPNRIIVLSSDSEGNYFSPVLDVSDKCLYYENGPRTGEIIPEKH